MRYDRLMLIVVIALAGLIGSWVILTWEDAPKAMIALSGLFLVAGVLATGALAIIVWDWIETDVRPAVRFRKPLVPLALASTQAALIGRASFIHHPVRFWGALTLNNSFVFGFMILDKPKHLTFDEIKPLSADDFDAEPTPQQHNTSTGDAG